MMRRASLLLMVVLWLVACGRPSSDGSAEGRAHDEREVSAPSPPAAEHAPATSTSETNPTVDGHSLQHLDADLTLFDQRGARFSLTSLAGRPTLLTFFYGSCTTMCPLIVSDVKRIVAALPSAQRVQLSVVLITIDPARDTSEQLRALATERSLPADWHLVTGDASSIRTIASTVGMTYRALPDGTFAHAALYTVLDGDGRVAHQLEGTGRSIDESVAALVRLLGARASAAPTGGSRDPVGLPRSDE